MRRERPIEISFYEWSIIRWLSSGTRAKLDGTGRGIIRELWDMAYAQGKIPNDHVVLSQYCGVTPEQFERYWNVIGKHFQQCKHDEFSLESKQVSVFRDNYLNFISDQRQNGKLGGRPKSNVINNKETSRLDNQKPWVTKAETQTNQPNQPNLTDLNQPTSQPILPTIGMACTAKAVRERWPESSDRFVVKLQGTVTAMMDGLNGGVKGKLTDELIAKAVRHCTETSPKQTSAGLYLKTVTQCVKTWLTDGVPSTTPEYYSIEKAEQKREAQRKKTK